MAKWSIEWHEDNLRNMKLTLQSHMRHAADLEARIERLTDDILQLQTQIDTAKERGKTSFDPDKFCKSRAKRR